MRQQFLGDGTQKFDLRADEADASIDDDGMSQHTLSFIFSFIVL